MGPTFLILGLYNKMVKQLGSDRTDNKLESLKCFEPHCPETCGGFYAGGQTTIRVATHSA